MPRCAVAGRAGGGVGADPSIALLRRAIDQPRDPSDTDRFPDKAFDVSEARPPDTDPTAPENRAIWRMALRLAVIAAIALGAHWLIGFSMQLAEQLPTAEADAMLALLLVCALIVYALLIAIPFVPGVEIGLALLLLRGASIAPEVYGATLAGLAMAFGIGRFVPDASLVRLLADLRLRRAAALVADYTGLPPAERQARLETRLPRWLAVPLVRYRYVTLGLLLNLPGNVLLGGGGGLMMLAGLSRLFRPRLAFATIAIAVLPVPFTIWWMGPGLLS